MKWILVMLLLSSWSVGQTISPVRVECSKKCNGDVTITNNGITPMSVTLQVFNFSIENGSPKMRNLDTGNSVQLSEQSSRVGPNEGHQFDYKIRCAVLPCNVAIYAFVSTGATNAGLNTKIALPHMVYVCQKESGCRKRALKAAGIGD